MLLRRWSLRAKIFAALLTATTLIVLAMTLMIGISMRAGFARYLVQAEINRFDDLEAALARTYDANAAGWPSLEGSPRACQAFVRGHLRPPGGRRPPPPPPPPPPSPGGRVDRPPPPRPGPLRTTDRIKLIGATGITLAAAEEAHEPTVRRPIMPIGEAPSAAPLGFIGLSLPRNAAGPADAAFLWGQLRSLALAAVLAIALSAAASLVLAKQFLAPLRALAQGTRALSAGDYAVRLPNGRSDELGVLIERTNMLAKSLEDAAAAERRWISDTSHDLKTPLAILRAEIEALQDGVRQPTGAVLESLHGSVVRLSALVSDLNTLARTREGGFSLVLEDADLGEIVNEALSQASSAFAMAGLDLSYDVSNQIKVTVDRERIRQLIDNLLENSRHYTSAPGHVRVAAEANATNARVHVEDSAPCPPKGSMDRLFDRFFRVEPSRSRQHGGSGLGLAICRAIAEAHGGQINATASRLGGLAITVSIPLAADQA